MSREVAYHSPLAPPAQVSSASWMAFWMSSLLGAERTTREAARRGRTVARWAGRTRGALKAMAACMLSVSVFATRRRGK